MCLSTLNVASAAIEPMGLLSDGVILQRQKPIPLWGWAVPRELITVQLNGQSNSAVADASGKWTLDLPAMEAGMDLTIQISGDQTERPIEIKDVAIGEVWLASGQSNMEWRLKLVDMSDVADEPENRMIREARSSGIGTFREPNEKCRGSWKIDTPQNRPDFSAAAYYFARELQQELGVPVGFITAAVGGTAVEPWTPRDVVESIPIRRKWAQDYWASFEGYAEIKKTFLTESEAWLLANERVDTRKQADPKVNLQGDADQLWVPVSLSKQLPESIYSGYGILWLRKVVDVAADAFKDTTTYLRIYTKDSYPDIYVNGELVQDTTVENYSGRGVWVTARINAGTLHAGANEIALRVYSPFVPFETDRAYTMDGVTMDANWDAQVEADFGAPSETAAAEMPQTPESQVGYGRLPGVHFNRFIAPLAGYGMRGVIWYQGETNAMLHEVEEYAQVFPAMIQAWRDLWGQPEMSFYYCQLAGYGSKTKDPSNVGWAPFRRAQEAALKLPRTGQAILIDVGESDIHPYDKKSVGDRLARLALARDYGKDVVDCGPALKSLSVAENGRIEIRFDSLADGLVAMPFPETYAVSKNNEQFRPLVRYSPGSQLEGFALQDADGKWHWADAEVEGDTVKVHSESVPQPTAIRYNWQGYPNGNLFNSAGLPAVPFEANVSSN